jgi:preprotein translocase subunit SecE
VPRTRAERRARRQGGEVAAAAPPMIPPRPRPVARAGGDDEPRSVPGSGTKRFISEAWGELRKVEWPNQSQVIQGTIVVLVACVIVGIYLYLADEVFKRLVQNVLLR